MKYDRFRSFRQDTYQLLGKAHDATFELMDSVMTMRTAGCLAEFSLIICQTKITLDFTQSQHTTTMSKVE